MPAALLARHVPPPTDTAPGPHQPHRTPAQQVTTFAPNTLPRVAPARRKILNFPARTAACATRNVRPAATRNVLNIRPATTLVATRNILNFRRDPGSRATRNFLNIRPATTPTATRNILNFRRAPGPRPTRNVLNIRTP